jgi:hypothetical protein
MKWKEFFAYLELVLASLSGWRWVEEINCENLFRQHFISNHLQNNEFHQSIHFHHSINLHSTRDLHIPPPLMRSELDNIVSLSCASSPLPPNAVMMWGEGLEVFLTILTDSDRKLY